MIYFLAFLLSTLIGLFVFTPKKSDYWWYCWRVWISVDQFINTAFFFGNEDHTISGHAGRKRREGKKLWTWFANAIDWVALHGFDDPNHCDNAIENDEESRHYNFGRLGFFAAFLVFGISTVVIGTILNAIAQFDLL